MSRDGASVSISVGKVKLRVWEGDDGVRRSVQGMPIIRVGQDDFSVELAHPDAFDLVIAHLSPLLDKACCDFVQIDPTPETL